MVSSGSFFSRRPKATFSYTFRCGNSAYFWNTVFTCRLYGGTEAISLPSKKTLPDFGVINPAITRKVVVLPQPEGPRNVTNSLSWMSRESSSRILSPSKSTTMSFSDTISFIFTASPFAEFSPTSGLLDAGSPAFPGGSAPIMPPRKRFVTPPQTRQLQQHIQRQCVLMFNRCNTQASLYIVFGGCQQLFHIFPVFYMGMAKSQLVSCLAPPFFPCPSGIIPCSPAAVCIKINRCRSQLFLSFHTTGARIVRPQPFTIFQGKMPLSARHAGR